MTENSAAAPENVENKLEHIMTLLEDRARGRVSDAQVEGAISQALGRPMIQPDTDNYDDDDEEEEEEEKTNQVSGKVNTVEIDQKVDEEKMAPPPQRGKKRNLNKRKPWWEESRWARLYDDLPLGNVGARMLTTFGGNPGVQDDDADETPAPPNLPPPVETVKAVLEGTRQLLQVAVQDARHVHRERKKAYVEAHSVLKTDASARTVQKQPHDSWAPEIMYGVDKNSYTYDRTGCGFGAEDLRELFPEEINAYIQWEMGFMEASKKAESGAETADVVDEKDPALPDPSESSDVALQDSDNVSVGGHLRERAAVFDIRTHQMTDTKSYLEFSDIRRGSFLSRKKDEQPKNMGAWGKVSKNSVRFLHWVGFDPNSALRPPDASLTHVLAFMGYDFFGRIVEKAIQLRLDRKGKTLIGELEPGDQLQPIDIENAMSHPDIKPIPLFSSDKDALQGPQLYFGPGFERRVELELDQFVSPTVTDDLVKLHKDDEELFRDLRAKSSSGVAAENEDKGGKSKSAKRAKRAKRS